MPSKSLEDAFTLMEKVLESTIHQGWMSWALGTGALKARGRYANSFTASHIRVLDYLTYEIISPLFVHAEIDVKKIYCTRCI